MSYNAQSAHSGGALSCVEILTVLYFHILKIDPNDPYRNTRDRLIFSKAHDAKALYAALALRGYFDTELLKKYEVDDAILAGHSIRHSVPGIELSAGSLGHGLSIAVGMALAAKLKKERHRIYAILSDGECDEGSTWEAILFAGHHKLDNLLAIVDYNKLQGFGRTKDILDLEPFTSKWRDFGWESQEVDGHNIKSLIATLSVMPFAIGKPSVLIAHTVKGYGGVQKYIDEVASQYKPPTEAEYKDVVRRLK